MFPKAKGWKNECITKKKNPNIPFPNVKYIKYPQCLAQVGKEKREKKNQLKLSQVKIKLKIILISNLFPKSTGTVQTSQCLKKGHF